MTMLSKAVDQSGQSILELVLTMPVLLMLVGLMYKFNLTAQVAINNNQFARAQVYVLAHNSPEYPRLQHRKKGSGIGSFVDYGRNRMVLSVVDPKGANAEEDDDDPGMRMIPTEHRVVRASANDSGSDARGEVKRRGNVRVRVSAAICTQDNFLRGGDGSMMEMNSKTKKALANQYWPFGQEVCVYGNEAS